MTKREFMLRCGFTEDELPPPDPPGMTEEESDQKLRDWFRESDEELPTIEDYRQAYRVFRAEWPGDDEVRRMYPRMAPADGAA